jgi:hypothetical protein
MSPVFLKVPLFIESQDMKFFYFFRIIMKKARTECQSHKLTVEDPVTLEYITRYVASMKQR